MFQHVVAVIGKGGREATLVRAYARSPHVKKVMAIPGNDSMLAEGPAQIEIFPEFKTTDVAEIVAICQKHKVSLVDIAQDNAVEAGLGDALQERGILFCGPTRAAGQIEWDKAWSRDFMRQFEIPHPTYQVCHSQSEGQKFIKTQADQKWFIKGAGLAEGKAALPASNNQEAFQRIKQMSHFGKAGETFLIERWLEGEEFSMYAICDGQNYQVIGSAQDHKRAFNFDEGENTGGMGCSSPPLLLTSYLKKQIELEIIKPTIAGMAKIGRPYTGILYLGGMIVRENGTLKPYVIEFNARWGDPEAQVMVPSLKTDLLKISLAIAQKNISKLSIKTDGKARVVIALASKGYPTDYSAVKGKEIFGLQAASKIKNVEIYGAGFKRQKRHVYADGGRLLYIVGKGRSVIEARQNAYQAAALIFIEGNNLHYRTDIGWRDVERLYT